VARYALCSSRRIPAKTVAAGRRTRAHKSIDLDYLAFLQYATAMMDADWLRQVCLSLTGTSEHIQWEIDLVFKVGGKMFAVAPLEPAPVVLSFKCSNDGFAELIERPGVIPAPYLARAQWIALESESALVRPELERLLRQAHALVVAKLPKKLQATLVASKTRQSKPRRKKLRPRKSRGR